VSSTGVESQALVVYLGKGTSPYPKPDPQALVDRFGDQGLDLLSYCQKVLNELYGVVPDWSVEDLATASARAVATVRARHPELSQDALDVLLWSYRWDWK
jgi:hypothetical protein